MATLTVENYVKAVYQLAEETGRPVATTGELARRLGVSPSTVSSMLRTLSESGLADYQAYEGARLTPAGQRLALRILRRHRLIELFLVRTVGLTWDEVHEEAEHLEHAVSDRLIDRIDAYLGHPASDPHGDPIPQADGSVPTTNVAPLAALPVGAGFTLARVTDQSPEFLRYLADSRLAVGARGRIVDRQDQAGVLTIATAEGSLSLGRDAAAKLMVDPQ